MSSYLRFFELEQSPFDTRTQSKLVLGTKALRDAYAQIQAGITDGAARICVSGGAGMGKTSLARALPKLLRDEARVVVLLNPSLPWSTLRTAIVKQLDLEGGTLSRRSLMAAGTGGRRLVLVVDAAEKISRESLEHLDILLAYQNDEDRQLLHCVMLANLDKAAEQEECPLLWWLDSLHTLQLEFAPIPPSGVETYIAKHLKRAGWKGASLFTKDAARTVHRLTGGVPRRISELCEKVLEIAAARAVQPIESALVEEVAGEPLGDDEVPQLVSESARATPASTPAPTREPQTHRSSIDPLDSFFGATPPARSAPAPEPWPTGDEPESGRTSAPTEPISAYAGAAATSFDATARTSLRRWSSARLAVAAVLVLAIGAGAAWKLMPRSDADETVHQRPIRRRPPPPLPASDAEDAPDVDIETAIGGAAGERPEPVDIEMATALDGVQASAAAGKAPEPFVLPEYQPVPSQSDAHAEAIREAVTGGAPARRTSPAPPPGTLAHAADPAGRESARPAARMPPPARSAARSPASPAPAAPAPLQ